VPARKDLRGHSVLLPPGSVSTTAAERVHATMARVNASLATPAMTARLSVLVSCAPTIVRCVDAVSTDSASAQHNGLDQIVQFEPAPAIATTTVNAPTELATASAGGLELTVPSKNARTAALTTETALTERASAIRDMLESTALSTRARMHAQATECATMECASATRALRVMIAPCAGATRTVPVMERASTVLALAALPGWDQRATNCLARTIALQRVHVRK